MDTWLASHSNRVENSRQLYSQMHTPDHHLPFVHGIAIFAGATKYTRMMSGRSVTSLTNCCCR